jgi:ABC-type transport system involved in cytochrome bd biosynthesis fused ATPase/permease subunit
MKPVDAWADIAQQINGFYLEAFGHALTVVGIVFGLVGVVVPTGIAFFQARQARHELEQLRKQISDEVALAVNAQKETLLRDQAGALNAFSERSDKVITDLRAETKKELTLARAGILHVQAVMYSRNKKYVQAFKSAVGAGLGYVKGEDFHHLRRVVEVLALRNLAHLDKQILETRPELETAFERLIDRMKNCDDKGAFTDLVVKCRRELEQARNRERKVPSASAGPA